MLTTVMLLEIFLIDLGDALEQFMNVLYLYYSCIKLIFHAFLQMKDTDNVLDHVTPLAAFRKFLCPSSAMARRCASARYARFVGRGKADTHYIRVPPLKRFITRRKPIFRSLCQGIQVINTDIWPAFIACLR